MAMAQQYPVHANMQPHAGMAHAHPMGQGQPHMGGQPQGMMPGMHGGPQVTQGGPIVTGMPPGTGVAAPGGPANAHAMAHLGGGPQMFQHPAMPFPNNPQAVHQQQLAMQQQRQRQQVQQNSHMLSHQPQQQQHPHGGMIAMAGGQPLSQAHMAQLRAAQQSNNMHMHILQQQQQQQAQQAQAQHHQQQQQQQQQQAQQQHQHLQAQANQPHPQSMQQHPSHMLHAQHQAQVQQAQAQAQAQQQQQQAQAQQAAMQRNVQQIQMQEAQNAASQSPQHQGIPARPQSAAATQAQSQQSIAPPAAPPPPTPQPQSQPQQTPGQLVHQLPPGGGSREQSSQPQPQSQQAQQQQQAQQAQQPGQTQQQGQQPNQQQSQQQQSQQQAQNAYEANRQYLQQQQRNTSLNLLMQPDMQKIMGGQVVLRFLSFLDRLSSPDANQANKFEFWEEFVAAHFAPGGSLQHQLVDMKSGMDKRFRISYPALAYYYHSHFTSGIKAMSMQPNGAIERGLPQGCHAVWFPRCIFTYIFKNDVHVIGSGNLKVNFDANQKIEYLEMAVTSWQELLPRLKLEPVDTLDMKSPKLNKNSKKAAQRPPQAPSVAVPQSMVSPYGITLGVMQNLEIAEALTLMEPLFCYSQTHDDLTPEQALNNLVQETARSTAAVAASLAATTPGGPMMGGQRTPGLNGPNQFGSPAIANLGLPVQGSPRIGGPTHSPSPAHMHMPGPVAMVHQHSQQGSNLSGSQGASANTSPNVTHKRRRPSGIKTEEEGGGEVNGSTGKQVKPSPRIGGKRQKGTS